MITDIIGIVWLIGVIVILIYTKILKIKNKKVIENSYETLAELQNLVLKESDEVEKIYFYPDKKAFINRTKSERKVTLVVSTFFLILFLGSFPLGLWENIYYGIENFMAKIGFAALAFTITGFLYYVIRYRSKDRLVIQSNLYYDTKKNMIFFDTNQYYYYKHYYHYNRYSNTDSPYVSYMIESKIRFGLEHIEQVIYSINSISHIVVDKDSITLFGNIIMTSFDKHIDSDVYLESVQLNKKVTFFENNENIQMFSKKLGKIKILRGYNGFEKFLISKQYSGSENL